VAICIAGEELEMIVWRSRMAICSAFDRYISGSFRDKAKNCYMVISTGSCFWLATDLDIDDLK